MGTISSWSAGLMFSLLIGHFVVGALLNFLRKDIKKEEREKDSIIPILVLGPVERLFFSVAVAFNISGIATAMIAWIAAKMVAYWNTRDGDNTHVK